MSTGISMRDIYAGGAGTGARQYRNQRQPWPAGWEGDPWKRGRSSRQRSNGFAQTLSVFFLFLGGLREPVAPDAGARGLLVCAGGAKAAWATPPGRVWWRFALALAHWPAPAERRRRRGGRRHPACGGGQSTIKPAFVHNRLVAGQSSPQSAVKENGK